MVHCGIDLVLKQVVDGGFKFQLGSVPLKRSENSSQRLVSMLDHLTSELAKYKKEVEKVRNVNNTISQEQEHMTQRLKEHIETHVNMEQELYTKFSMVLNSKKAKIRELKKTIESGGGSSSDKSSNIPQKHAKRRLVESDEDMETDDEKQTIKDHNKKRKLSSTDEDADEEERTTNKEERGDEKDTAKEGEKIRLDDSIGDDDDMPRRSRKRMRATKPKTPVSSVLPRTTSLPRPNSVQKSSSGTGSSQRSERSSRNTSSEVSVDELLDNL
ncbi:protein FAM133-like [Clytia hemisphaerica]|uniref:protein FAM133-like n=1 Tax=Clytia hemisphaerica TaxID=252671 RepID=UPI0034D6E179